MKKLHRWWKTYVKSIRKDLVFMLLADLIFLLVMEIFLRNIPAPFPIFVKIGDLFVTLAISFLASFIFFFVQVHLPETRQKANVYPSMASWFNRIVVVEKTLLTNYVGQKNYPDLTEEEVRNGASVRDASKQDAPLHLAGVNRNANWIEYGINQVADIDKYWELLMKYSSYLDSECLSILAGIQEDSLLQFFRTMRTIYKSVQFGRLQGFDELFFRFWKTIQSHEKYYADVFAQYGKDEAGETRKS